MEVATLRRNVEQQASRHAVAALMNQELIKAGLTEAQSAVLTAAARMLFNTDNFMTRK